MPTSEAGIVGSNGGASQNRRNGPHPCNNQATITPVFEGSDPPMKGCYYDLPSDLNQDHHHEDGDHNGF